MIEEKLTISFDLQDFEFEQQVNENDTIMLNINDESDTWINIGFSSEEQIQKVIDNLYRQMNILRDAKKSSTESTN